MIKIPSFLKSLQFVRIFCIKSNFLCTARNINRDRNDLLSLPGFCRQHVIQKSKLQLNFIVNQGGAKKVYRVGLN